VSLVDAYDAMTEERPYGNVKTKAEACDEICSNAGTQFDPDLAKLFIERILGYRFELPQGAALPIGRSTGGR
jgi:diguanylate cyclase